MGRTLAILLLALLVPSTTRALHATIGVYDDVELTRTSGVMTGFIKVIYVGIRFEPGWEGFTGIEFSVAGLGPFTRVVEYLGNPNLVIGTIAAPTDTTNGTGGLNMAWPFCVVSNQVVVAKLTLYSGRPLQDHVIRVRQRFSPIEPERPSPLFVLCDGPWVGICTINADGGSYTLNPTIAVESRPWGAVKQLYSVP